MLPEDDYKKIAERLGREPTEVEQGCFLNLWSEHCSYRSSSAILKTFTTTGERVIIGPGDDAAIVRLEDGWVMAIGMESHNHPSYVDPYNGAATGVGGREGFILYLLAIENNPGFAACPFPVLCTFFFKPFNGCPAKSI